MSLLSCLLALLRDELRTRRQLLLENLALRQQLGVLRRQVKRPQLSNSDRLFWVVYARLVAGWRGCLHLLSPETVLDWQRKGFRAYWRRKCRHKMGRPLISRKLMCLIWRLQRENPTWGEKRIAAELALLGHTVGSSTVGRYMHGKRGTSKSAQKWMTFLRNNIKGIAACDFFVVPTIAFQRLFVFVILSHDRRLIRHVAVTRHSSVAWVSREIRVALADSPPAFLVHDREKTFMMPSFLGTLAELRIEDKRTAPRQPWMNGYCERVIGSFRRECTDHMLVWNERHLQRLLAEYVAYYNSERPHLSLERNAPLPRAPAAAPAAELLANPVLGGLHHRYRPAA